MPNNILITPGSASIQFSGSAANTIRLQVENSGSIAFYGNSGSLFGISDSLSGSLMSVNDVSGLPILEVFSDDRVVMGSFNKNTLVVTGSRIGIDKAIPTTDLDISGSVFITGSLRMSSGGITGSLFGTSSVATSASFAPTILPSGVVSSSSQINTGSFSGSFTGTLIGTSSWANNAVSSSFATTSSAATSITFIPPTASFATTASFALNATVTLPSGVVSSSSQINTGSFSGSITTSSFATTASYALSSSFAPTILPSGLVSSSAQISYTGLVNVPTNIVSSSTQVTAFLPTGTVSGSGQVSYAGLSNIPANIVSSSAQVTALLPTGTISSSIQINTGSFTGSFVGRFTGSLFGTSSFATTASAATSITFTPTSASFATTASFAVSASWAPTGVGSAGLTTKAGNVANTSFTGNPRRAAVNFSSAFSTTNYAIVITGEDARSWTVEGKVVGGFTASANSNTGLAGTTYWIATAYGET